MARRKSKKKSGSFKDFAVTVGAVEVATGLNFFSKVPPPKPETAGEYDLSKKLALAEEK